MKNNTFLMVILMTIAFLFILVNINLIIAPAISGAYTNERPLEMHAGEEREIVFGLQNGGEEDIKFIANITKGNEVMSFIDENREYLVPAGTNNVTVKLKVKIPEKSREEYDAEISFEPVSLGSENKGGMVQLEIGLSRAFKVKVIDSQESSEGKKTSVDEKRSGEETGIEKLATEKTGGNTIIFWWILVVMIIITIIIFSWLLIKERKIKRLRDNIENNKFGLFLLGMLLFFIFFLNFSIIAVEKFDVSVRVVEKISAGDIVEINNQEFQGQEAEVISVDEKEKEASVRLLSEVNSVPIKVRLADIKVIREEEELGALRVDWNFLFILPFLFIIFLAFVFVFRRWKRKRAVKELKEARKMAVKRKRKISLNSLNKKIKKFKKRL